MLNPSSKTRHEKGIFREILENFTTRRRRCHEQPLPRLPKPKHHLLRLRLRRRKTLAATATASAAAADPLLLSLPCAARGVVEARHGAVGADGDHGLLPGAQADLPPRAPHPAPPHRPQPPQDPPLRLQVPLLSFPSPRPARALIRAIGTDSAARGRPNRYGFVLDFIFVGGKSLGRIACTTVPCHWVEIAGAPSLKSVINLSYCDVDRLQLAQKCRWHNTGR